MCLFSIAQISIVLRASALRQGEAVRALVIVRNILSPLAFPLTSARSFTKLVLDRLLTNSLLSSPQRIEVIFSFVAIAAYFAKTLEVLQW